MQYNLFLFSNIITFYIFFFILHFKFVKFKINQFAQTFIFTAPIKDRSINKSFREHQADKGVN